MNYKVTRPRTPRKRQGRVREARSPGGIRKKPAPRTKATNHYCRAKGRVYDATVPLPWLPKGKFERIEVVRNRGGLGDFLQILAACEELQRKSGSKVVLYGPRSISDVGRHSPVKVEVAGMRNPASAKLLHEPIRRGIRVYLDFPCPTGLHEMKGKRLDRLTIFHRALRVEPNHDKLQIPLTKEEIAIGEKWCKTKTKVSNPIILIGKSSSKWKDYEHTNSLRVALQKSGFPSIVLPENLTIRVRCAILRHARLVISPDTGWLHVAAFLKRPVFGLFGAQDPYYRQAFYQSPGTWHQGRCPHNCQPCWYKVCGPKSKIQPCMKTPPQQIAAEVREFLGIVEGKNGSIKKPAPRKPEKDPNEVFRETYYFYHIPKNAGRTIERACHDDPYFIYPAQYPDRGYEPHYFYQELSNGSKIFSYLRNPLTRLVSAWYEIQKIEGNHAWFEYVRSVDPNKFFEDEEVLRAIAEKASDSMLLSQCAKLKQLGHRLKACRVFRVEDGVREGLIKLGFNPPEKMVTLNKCRSEKFVLTEEAKGVIRKVYADDFRLWEHASKSMMIPKWLLQK